MEKHVTSTQLQERKHVSKWEERIVLAIAFFWLSMLVISGLGMVVSSIYLVNSL